MRKPHFFKAHSNLGTRLLWHNVICDLDGTKNSPKDFLNSKLLKNYPQASVEKFEYTDSRIIEGWEDYVQTYVEDTASFAGQIGERLLAHETAVIVGGEHSVALASVLSDLQRFKPQEVGVLIFDSHEDFLQSKDSRKNSTGNFHGMWLRPLFTKFDREEVDELVPKKIPLANLMYVGNLDIEKEPLSFLQKQQVPMIAQDEIKKDLKNVVKKINHFIARFPHLHLSFDMDVLQAKDFVSTDPRSSDVGVNLPYEGGMEKEIVWQIVKALQIPKSLTLDLVEFNVKRKGFKDTKAFGERVLAELLTTRFHR